MVDLRAMPFCLADTQIQWVEETIAGMTLDEKLGQLFVLLKTNPGVNEEEIETALTQSHQGGLRWQGGDADTVYLQNTTYQKHSKIPLLIATNCDDGGNGVVPEGTFVATAAECGAGNGTEHAYHVGLVAGREASAAGCNWMFNPVCDIYKNWRNTIVNTRSFGSDPDKVIANARAYIKGIKDATTVVAINNNQNAPIFKNCDYGIIGDLLNNVSIPCIIDVDIHIVVIDVVSIFSRNIIRKCNKTKKCRQTT